MKGRSWLILYANRTIFIISMIKLWECEDDEYSIFKAIKPEGRDENCVGEG